MIRKLFRWFICSAVLSVCFGRAAAAEPAIIAKARAYIAPEAVLNSITSVHLKGTIQEEGDEKMTLEIILQKPSQQRMVISGTKLLEITALDEYEAWRKVQDPKDPQGWRLSLLRPDQVKRLRANTFESLYFYRGLEGRGGVVEDMGSVTVDGKTLRKISFRHSQEIFFIRCFDPETGRLVQTETGQGVIREEGEINVNGVRFPKRVISSIKNQSGKTAQVVIEFESVVLNERIAQSLFAVPPLTNRP